MLCWLILTFQLFLRNQVGESSKQGIQAAWSTPIYHVMWWISHFRGIYRALRASQGSSFWYYLKAFGHYVMSQGAPCWLLLVFYICPCILFVIVITTFIVNIIFLIFIRIFIKTSVLFLCGKWTVWFCFFQFLHLF